MAEESKKISFGFAKSIKKTTLVKQIPQEEKKVDYIECLDEKAIKVIGEEEKKEELLVIPLLGSRTWHDRIINKIDADIFETKTLKNEILTQDVKVKEEPKEISNGDLTSLNENVSDIKIKTELIDQNESEVSNLEEQAAKEIMADLKSTEKDKNELNNLTLPLAEDQNLRGVEISTLDDYEKIPVDVFGLAMLRGMGWKPGKGIGKNEKIVAAAMPELRPKGMGLGADKVALQKQNGEIKKEEEELRMVKGSFVKIIAGKMINAYGEIEGFDEDVGRLIVKMALGGDTISVNECTVKAVTKAEYLKNSKVLNTTKYEKYKERGSTSRKRSVSLESSSNSDSNNPNIFNKKRERETNSEYRFKKSSKKSKSKRRDSSHSDNDNKKRNRKRKSTSDSDTDKERKVKKSKRHKEKDKRRERTRDKKSRYSESPNRRKSNKHKRSRSPNRR